ncbi:MAG: (deoxy)nucleoside triphosphate pyrophosphohydrolase [Spirochaetaceae bacterium]|jgi:8-oxo-dGTP diphosphatase|nr:(deoxy)nucleoside triphosphate pyrophosphohydrolase [Spirochaetaceae bacterium]
MAGLSCAALAFKDGAVFAARRLPGGEMSGRWELPGGKVEDGEDAEQALIRELDEELGVQAHCYQKLAECRFVHRGIERTLAAYRVDFPADGVVLREHSEWRWVDAQQAQELDWTPSDYDIVRQITQKNGRFCPD